MSKTRLEAFSDAVIAIIMTVMVLELKVPHEVSWAALHPLWPVLISYVASFVTLGIYWGNHHHLLHTIKEVRGGILWANLHLLFWLSLIPFVTAWMGETHFQKITVAVYAALVNMCGIAYYILLVVMKKCNPGNLALQSVLSKQSVKGTISCLLYIAAIGTAFIHVAISGLLIVIVSVMWLIPDRNIEKAIDQETTSPSRS